MPETKQLYHFLPAKFALQAIERRQLKAADLHKVNDPFEALVMAFENREYENAFLKFRKNILGGYGTICFSQTWEEPLLWGHYADSFEGICLGFDALVHNDRTDVIRKIQYVPQRIDSIEFCELISWFRGSREPGLFDKAQAQLLTLMHTKSCKWAYEKEWRSWIRKEHQDPDSGFYFYTFNDMHIKL